LQGVGTLTVTTLQWSMVEFLVRKLAQVASLPKNDEQSVDIGTQPTPLVLQVFKNKSHSKFEIAVVLCSQVLTIQFIGSASSD